MKPYMQQPGHETRIYPLLQSLVSDTMMRSVKDLRAMAKQSQFAGHFVMPIHDEITIEVPSDGQARRLISRLARLFHPVPPPALVDPVAAYLVRHYGVPSRSTT